MLRVDYSGVGVAGSCDLIVQGPLAVRADVMVDRSQPAEDRVQPLTINQVNDSGLRLQGCGEVAGIPGFAGEGQRPPRRTGRDRDLHAGVPPVRERDLPRVHDAVIRRV